MSQHTTDPSSNEIPCGYCHCGCGQKTTIAPKTDRSNGSVKGQPRRYIRGHHNRVMPRTNQAASLKEAFLRHAKESTPLDCWEWQGAKTPKGYGVCTYKQRRLLAHRAAYEIYHGEIPDGLLVCHSCDNPGCVNPNHLWTGTAQDNTNDMVAKRRSRYPSPRPGSANNQAILTEDQVRQVRTLHNQGTYKQKQLARMFGVSKGAIQDVIKRRTWRHVP